MQHEMVVVHSWEWSETEWVALEWYEVWNVEAAR